MRRVGKTTYVKLTNAKFASQLAANSERTIMTSVPDVFNTTEITVAGVGGIRGMILYKNATGGLNLVNVSNGAIATSAILRMNGSYYIEW